MSGYRVAVEIRDASGEWQHYDSISQAADAIGMSRRRLSDCLARGTDGLRYADQTIDHVARRKKNANRPKPKPPAPPPSMTPHDAMVKLAAQLGRPVERLYER